MKEGHGPAALAVGAGVFYLFFYFFFVFEYCFLSLSLSLSLLETVGFRLNYCLSKPKTTNQPTTSLKAGVLTPFR